MIQKSHCDICKKNLIALSEYILGDEKYVSYKCGHTLVYKLDGKAPLVLTNVKGDKHARDYQVNGIDFIANGAPGNENGFNCILGDQMRIGKTPQFLMALRSKIESERSKGNEDFKCLIILRATNARQWLREYKDWVSTLPLGVYLIEGSKNWIPPGFGCYIISMDTFSADGTCKNCGHALNRHDDITDRCSKGQRTNNHCPCRNPQSAGDSMTDRLLGFGFKVCAVDEAHAFKNTSSKRAKALGAFLKQINQSEITHEVPFHCMLCKHEWTERVTVNVNTMSSDGPIQSVSKTSHCPSCLAVVSQKAAAHVKVTRNCGVVFLTGTAIKNRADELFIPLNIVAPEHFPSLESYRRNWLVQNDKGQWARVNPRRYDQFKSVIAPFYLRREKEDVYKDLPALNRIFTVIEISDGRLKDAYNKVLDRLESKMTMTNFSYFDSIGDLMILRQICGLAKVKFTVDYVETMIYDSDKAKLAIGVHHHSVRDNLKYELSQWGVVKLDGEDNAERKDYLAHKYFEHSPERVMILGMMAAKEGLELLYIPKALVLEREFTAADEEQFEFRFFNPDLELLKQRGYENKRTEIEYIVAKGTIDEFFYDIVEEKRKIFGETLGTNWNLNEDKGSFKNLMERTVSGRL